MGFKTVGQDGRRVDDSDLNHVWLSFARVQSSLTSIPQAYGGPFRHGACQPLDVPTSSPSTRSRCRRCRDSLRVEDDVQHGMEFYGIWSDAALAVVEVE